MTNHIAKQLSIDYCCQPEQFHDHSKKCMPPKEIGMTMELLQDNGFC